MSPEVQAAEPAPSAEPFRVSDMAAGFLAELEAEAPSPKPQPAAPVEAAPEPESAAPEAEAAQPEQAEPSQEEPATPDIDLPRGMSAEEKALFAQLPPEAKAWLAKREKEAQSDYTRKTQEVAEHRKAVEADRARYLDQIKQYDQILSHFTARQIEPPDRALKHTDPLGYEEQLGQYIHAKHQQEKAIAEQQRVRSELEQETKAQQQRYWNEQNATLQKLAPELADASEKGKAARLQVFEYATKQGYSPQQLNNASAIDLVTLWKAQRYDAAMSKKPAVAPVAAPKVMQPGPAKAAGKSNGFAGAVRSLSENPSRAALAAAYRAELANER